MLHILGDVVRWYKGHYADFYIAAQRTQGVSFDEDLPAGSNDSGLQGNCMLNYSR